MEVSKKKRIREILVRFVLFLGVVYFGFIFPDSFSNHEKMVHFGAHVGMSFLIASSVYFICHMQLRMTKNSSYVVLLLTILVVGAVYKYFEISGEGILHAYSLRQLLLITGCYASMSQNLAGALAAILLIKYVLDYQQFVWRNLGVIKMPASPPWK
jgi:hypothetical protein